MAASNRLSPFELGVRPRERQDARPDVPPDVLPCPAMPRAGQSVSIEAPGLLQVRSSNSAVQSASRFSTVWATRSSPYMGSCVIGRKITPNGLMARGEPERGASAS